jgi:hypothetical protein
VYNLKVRVIPPTIAIQPDDLPDIHVGAKEHIVRVRKDVRNGVRAFAKRTGRRTPEAVDYLLCAALAQRGINVPPREARDLPLVDSDEVQQ